jgi:hypothetical protein
MGNSIVYFNHQVGNGIHYITDNPRELPGKRQQLGDTSDLCILSNLDIVLSYNNLPQLNDVWNSVYPGDFMSDEDLACILNTAVNFSENFDPGSLDNITAVLDDVRELKCEDLANKVSELLKENGMAL